MNRSGVSPGRFFYYQSDLQISISVSSVSYSVHALIKFVFFEMLISSLYTCYRQRKVAGFMNREEILAPENYNIVSEFEKYANGRKKRALIYVSSSGHEKIITSLRINTREKLNLLMNCRKLLQERLCVCSFAKKNRIINDGTVLLIIQRLKGGFLIALRYEMKGLYLDYSLCM